MRDIDGAWLHWIAKKLELKINFIIALHQRAKLIFIYIYKEKITKAPREGLEENYEIKKKKKSKIEFATF